MLKNQGRLTDVQETKVDVSVNKDAHTSEFLVNFTELIHMLNSL